MSSRKKFMQQMQASSPRAFQFPAVPYQDENDRRIEEWKQREREKARKELVERLESASRLHRRFR